MFASHVLLVDDLETNQLFAEHALRKINPAGKVTCVSSGEAAIKLLQSEEGSFSMVFLDVEMPGMDGVATACAIREFNQLISIVALTAHDDSATLNRCLAVGMDGLVSKPFREASLAKMMSLHDGKQSGFSLRLSARSAYGRPCLSGFYADQNRPALDKYLKKLEDAFFKPKALHRACFLADMSVDEASDPMEVRAMMDLGASKLRHASAGASFSCFVTEGGGVAVVGPDTVSPFVFCAGKREGHTAVLPVRVTNVAAGTHHVVAWSASTKHLFSWGENGADRPLLGRDTASTTTPGAVTIEGNVLEAACGDNHTLVITDVGLYGFGLNSYGQLGQMGLVVSVPRSIFVGNNVVSLVACGSNHSLLVTSKAEVFCWGANLGGQCGQPCSGSSALAVVLRPIKVDGLPEVVRVDGGASHSIALSRTGKVFSWGTRGNGELGRRIAASATHEPGMLDSLACIFIVHISANGHRSAAVDWKGSVFVWGCLQGEQGTQHAKIPRLLSHPTSGVVDRVYCGLTHCLFMMVPTQPARARSKSAILSMGVMEKDSDASDSSLDPSDTHCRVRSLSSSSTPELDMTSLSPLRSLPQPRRRTSVVVLESPRGAAAPIVSDHDRTLVTPSASEDVIAHFSVTDPRLELPVVMDAYRAFAESFLGENVLTFVAHASAGSRIVLVKRLPHTQPGMYSAIVFNHYGIFKTKIDQAAVLGSDFQEAGSPRDLDIKLLTWLINNWTSSFDRQLAGYAPEFCIDPRPQNTSWRLVALTRSRLMASLLVLESRLGLQKRFAVGLICNVDAETEEDALANAKNRQWDEDFHKFCSVIADKVTNKATWPHYAANMLAIEGVASFWYTSWRGFEIVFYNASAMSADQQRQHLGNCKCLLFFTKNRPMPVSFRGKVNSAAVVVQWIDGAHAAEHAAASKTTPVPLGGWRVALSQRAQLWNLKPVALSPAIISSKHKLRDTVLANLVNSQAAVTRSVKGYRRLFAAEVDAIAKDYAGQTSL